MKIAVIGAGIIGVTTAYELACDGHEVRVFERRSAAAEESSFANTGILAPGYVTPWAAPGMTLKVLLQHLTRHPQLRVGLPLSVHDLGWIWKFFRACELSKFTLNRSRMQRLALFSQQRLTQLCEGLQFEYDNSSGIMVLLRSEKTRQSIQGALKALNTEGIPFHELDAVAARKIEPALNPDTSIHSAIQLPDDGVGNCRQFALLLKNEALRLGVIFNFNKRVTSIDTQHGISLRIEQDDYDQVFDAAVVSAGVDSTKLLSPLGLELPLASIYGYSISAPVREPLNAPRSAIVDEHYKVAISRIGNRVRVTGGAEIGGLANQHRASTLRTLYKVLQDWYPGAANLTSAIQVWKGAQPFLPDGMPLVGQSKIPGLWLNLGHGSSGWALSCGSAKIVADLISGKTADLDIQGLGLDRFNA